jgi:hypothetical protein
VVPDRKPSAVYEPRISADRAAERLGVFRAEVEALLERSPSAAGDHGTR